MKKLMFTMAVLAGAMAFAATDYEKLGAKAADDKDAAPIGTEWHAQNLAAVEKATTDEALAKFLASAHTAGALLSRVKSGYQTNPLDAIRIAAVSQYVMVDVGSSWYEFWREHRDDERQLWTKALLRAASKANGAYLQEYFLDQLRWCGYPCQAKCVRKIGEKAKTKAVKEFVELVARELESR